MFLGTYKLEIQQERIDLPREWQPVLAGQILVMREDEKTHRLLFQIKSMMVSSPPPGAKEIAAADIPLLLYDLLSERFDHLYALGLGDGFEISEAPESDQEEISPE
jgi:hypothetical protein